MKKKPLVFLGSGVSLPSFEKANGKGYGSTENLTNALFEKSWFLTTVNDWRVDAPHGSRSPYQPPCQEFLSRLRKWTEDYYSDERGSLINYEDLYSLTQQISDEAGWSDNAAIKPFRVEINKLCADLCDPHKTICDKPLERLALETLGFIQNVIASKLCVEVPTIGFDLLKALAGLSGVEPLTICTLNHDLLVERYLEAEFIPYTNGFGQEQVNGVRYVDRTEFARNDFRVKLLKLHGSINWWRLVADGKSPVRDRLGIPVRPLEECRSVAGERLSKRDSVPWFLTGSDNKLIDYQAGIFLAQLREFDRALDEHDLIVMSGYGWGDKGINIRLISWVFEKQGRQIILLHEKPDKLHPQRALLHTFKWMVNERKLIPVRKWMCDVDARKLYRCFERKMHYGTSASLDL